MSIIHSTREAWLLWRKEHLTASDCATALGENPWRGPLALYLEKTGQAESAEESLLMRRGRRFERAILDEFEEEYEKPLEHLPPFSAFEHMDLPWLGATPDDLLKADGSPVDAKMVGPQASAEWKDDGSPDIYQIQAQIQIACTAKQAATLVALVGGYTLKVREQKRHGAFLDAALPKLEEFWMRVQRKDPPPADATVGTTDAIKRAFAGTTGEQITLDEDALDLVETWEQVKASNKESGKAELELQNRLKMLLGAAAEGVLPDGRIVSWPVVEREGYTVASGTYRRMSVRKPRRLKA